MRCWTAFVLILICGSVPSQNPVIRVSDAGTVTAASFNSKGVLLPPAPPPTGSGPDVNVPGDWRLQYTYDGLGRLARKESPVTPGGSEARREDYRYDGVRRIQEAVTRWSGAVVIPGGEEQGASGGTNPGQPGEGDPGAITLGGLEEPVEATELEPFGEGTLLLALPEEWDQREYVWGPDYVDELAFQFDRDGPCQCESVCEQIDRARKSARSSMT